MTQDEARSLREGWKTKGGKPCMHMLLELEKSDVGRVTGSYFCVICGDQVYRADSR